MSFKIGSLRCMKYIDKKLRKYQPLPFFWVGGQRYVPNFEKRPKSNECVCVCVCVCVCGRGAGERGCLLIFVWGVLTVFLVKKDCKIKFEDPIPNVDLC